MPTLSPNATLGQVAHIIHAAVLLGPAAWGRIPMPEAHMEADIEQQLKRRLIELFTILHQRQIPYVLVGGIAMLTYIEGRNTNGVDLVLSVDSLKQLPELVVTDQNREFIRSKFGALMVDVLLNDNPLFNLVEQNYSISHRFLEMNLNCATIEGLILMKMFALPSLYRQGQIQKALLYEGDISILYERGRPPVDRLFSAIQPFVADAELADLKLILGDIQRRVERIDRAKL